MKSKLTTKFIESIKLNPAKRLDFRDDLMPGLVLRVSPSGTRTFCLHGRVNGTMRRVAIGRYGVITLAEARERVRQVHYEIESGRFWERTGVEVENRITLGEVIPDYFEKHAKSQNRDWRNKQSLLAKFTDLHGKRLDQIKRADVVKAFTETVHALHPNSPILPEMSTGASDARPFRVAGIPVYGVDGSWGIVPIDNRAHGRDERLPVKALDDDVDHWVMLLTKLAGK